MNSIQVAAYLRTACSVLNFDIGELWIARKISDQRPTLKFIQLYTSPTYEDYHSLLLRPDIQHENLNDDEKHRISPIICRGVCDGGQIVWASTLIQEGLIGKKELPLNTAVGIPICSLGQDLGIMVLFAVQPIAITPNAIEFLEELCRAASENIAGFIPPSLTVPVSPANVEPFVGIWDIQELIKKYSSDISFHILPIGPLQSFFDFQESMTFKDIGMESSNSASDAQISSISDFKQVNDVNSFADFTVPVEGFVNGSSFSLAYTSVEKNPPLLANDTIIERYDTSVSVLSEKHVPDTVVCVDARDSYRKSPSRFHELMIALLGMTIFDACELWMTSEKSQELQVIAALHRDGIMQEWTTLGRNLKLKKGQDVAGRVSEISQPYWDNVYNKKLDDIPNYPRAKAAASIGVKTALGIPLPGFKGTSGALTLYSTSQVDVEPMLAAFVSKAIQLISASSIGNYALSRIGIEGLLNSPYPLVSDLVDGPSTNSNSKSENTVSTFKSKQNSFPMKIQMMGSLAQNKKTPISNSNAGRENSHQKPINNHHISLSDSLLEAAEFVLNGNIVYSEHILNEIPLLPFDKDNDEESFSSKKLVSGISSPKDYNSSKSVVSEGAYESSADDEVKTNGNRNNDKHFNNTLAGTRRCQFEGCTKCAQGATKFCIGHGGGRRCTFPGCMKGARDKFFCAGHGGGKRCSVPDCTKSAVGGSVMCTLHGGGKRCSYPGCTKSSQSSTNYCVKHGGGRKCAIPGCDKVSRGRTDFCAAHGGGIRCCMKDCNKAAVGKYQLCRMHQSSISVGDLESNPKYLNPDPDYNSYDEAEYSPPKKRSNK